MILGLDLGKSLGWCLGSAVGTEMRFGTVPLKNTTDLGDFLQSSDEFLSAVLPLAKGIAVEQPFLGDSYWPARKALALLGHVYYMARFYGIGSSQISEIPIATGKLALSGSGKADKDQMCAAAARLGYPDLDEHQSDALGVWWVYVFGRAEPIRKARSKSSPGKIITP